MNGASGRLMTGETRPNLFVIGAPKCGTSALCAYLSDRDDVFICTPKEPFYLCFDFPELRARNFLETEADYLALFAEADPARHRIVGEGSTNYLRSRVAVDEALALSPDARFIVMLRSPIEIAHAYHMEQVFSHNEDVTDFETAWNLQESRARGENLPRACTAPAFLQYREIARTGAQLERLFARTSEAQRLVLLQEEMKASTRDVYLRTLAFLGLPDDGREDFGLVNSSHQHRYAWLADLVLSPPPVLRGPIKGLRDHLRRTRPPAIEKLKRFLRVKGERNPIPPELRRRMAQDFEADVRLTERLLGRDLDHWLAPAREPAPA